MPSSFYINANIVCLLCVCVCGKSCSNCLEAVTLVRLYASVTIKSGFVCVSGAVLCNGS